MDKRQWRHNEIIRKFRSLSFEWGDKIMGFIFIGILIGWIYLVIKFIYWVVKQFFI